MKLINLLFLITSIVHGYSQNLDGVWQGYDSMPSGDGSQSRIVLSFSRNSDSSYKIFSYTRFVYGSGKDTVIVFDVLFKKTKKYFILEEKKVNTDEKNIYVLQKMYLKYDKYETIEKLSGFWVGVDSSPVRANIYFIKIK